MARKGVVYQQGQPFSAGSVLVNTDRLIVGVIGTANSSPLGPPSPPPSMPHLAGTSADRGDGRGRLRRGAVRLGRQRLPGDGREDGDAPVEGCSRSSILIVPARLAHPEAVVPDEGRITQRPTRPGADTRSVSPISVAHKINRELVVLLGWGRAILLQFAHPLVAAAVARHSGFDRNLASYVRRTHGTVSAMLALTFGTERDARAAVGPDHRPARSRPRYTAKPDGHLPSGNTVFGARPRAPALGACHAARLPAARVRAIRRPAREAERRISTAPRRPPWDRDSVFPNTSCSRSRSPSSTRISGDDAERERRRRRDRHGSGARGRTALAAARRRRPAAGRSGPPGDDRSPPRADPERLRLRLECAPRARLEGGGTPRARLSELPSRADSANGLPHAGRELARTARQPSRPRRAPGPSLAPQETSGQAARSGYSVEGRPRPRNYTSPSQPDLPCLAETRRAVLLARETPSLLGLSGLYPAPALTLAWKIP